MQYVCFYYPGVYHYFSGRTMLTLFFISLPVKTIHQIIYQAKFRINHVSIAWLIHPYFCVFNTTHCFYHTANINRPIKRLLNPFPGFWLPEIIPQ